MSYAKPVPAAHGRADEGNNPLALVSLILGIVGLVTGGCPFSLAAAITGWMGMKREPQGTAKIGFWLGVVGMILQAALGLFLLLFFGAALGLGLTAVKMEPAPMAPTAPPIVVEAERAPVAGEPAPMIEGNSVEPTTEPTSETDPIEPAIEEVPSTAP